MLPDDARHGTNAGHSAGCRCTPCRGGKMRYDKRRRWELHSTGQRRVVPSYRVVRRVHALQALGYAGRVIAEESGLITKTLYDISLERSRSTRRAHFEAIAEAYERLAATVPTGPYVGRNRRYAASKGWPPPLAWDDIDDIDEHPTGWQYLTADRAESLTELVALGASVSEACRRIHVSQDALQTWCARNGMSETYRALAAREHQGGGRNVWNAEQVAS